MKQRTLFVMVLAVAAFLIIMGLARGVTAQTGDEYAITWFSINGGAGAGAGNDYALNGIAGQALTGPVLSGDGYALIGGLWPGVYLPAAPHHIFLPLLVRQ